MEHSVINSFFLKPTNEKDINSVLKRVKTNNALSPNMISTKILKMSQQIIEKPLAYLTNISFSTGVFPDLLKTPNFITALKKGNNQDYNNYQTISVISNLSKLIERLVHKILYNSLENHFLLFEKQYGFLNKMSTNHALIDITNKFKRPLITAVLLLMSMST